MTPGRIIMKRTHARTQRPASSIDSLHQRDSPPPFSLSDSCLTYLSKFQTIPVHSIHGALRRERGRGRGARSLAGKRESLV
jgi:hypothetical protein